MKNLAYLLTVAEKFTPIWNALQDVDKDHANKPLPEWKLELMEKVSTAINGFIIEIGANQRDDPRLKQAFSAYLYFLAELYRDVEDDSTK